MSVTPRASTAPNGFTLIEIMVVIAIMGLVMAMGMPSIISAFKREGMRKAIYDVEQVCQTARADAIFHNHTTWVYFYPQPADRRFQLGGDPVTGGAALADVASFGTNSAGGSATSGVLPEGVQMAMLDINQQDFAESPWGRVRFFPNGTCDEMVLVLHFKDQFRKISLEYSTAMTDVTEVDH